MQRSFEILLVEDNPGDVRLLQEVLKGSPHRYRVRVAENGLAALELLGRGGRNGRLSRPHLILLDLNLPKKDGREVLAELKRDAALRAIPVVVLTSSGAAEDVSRVYELSGNAFITKPTNLDDYIRVIRAIEGFWFSTAELPTREPV